MMVDSKFLVILYGSSYFRFLFSADCFSMWQATVL